MILNVCNDPDFLSILLIVNVIIKIIQIGAPLVLIIMGMVDVVKSVVSSSDKILSALGNIKWKLISAAMIFLVPAILDFVLSVVALTDVSYTGCLENANEENIKVLRIEKAESAVFLAEVEEKMTYVSSAEYLVSLVENDSIKEALYLRLEAVKEKIKLANKEEYIDPGYDPGSSGGLVVEDIIVPTNPQVCTNGLVTYQEPSPMTALNYWDRRGLINKNNFILPKDKKTGLPLGAWPKNYATVKTKLSNPKTYKGVFIWPVTPTNGDWDGSYEHNGIDIGASFGEPIYAPASGTLLYSEWAHTVNKGCDETAYSITIVLDEAIQIENVAVKQLFLTHMSGIRYRCTPGNCNRRVTRGELIGFVGNAAGTASSTGGWAPHLHMTFYNASGSGVGLTTSQLKRLYNINTGDKRKAGE